MRNKNQALQEIKQRYQSNLALETDQHIKLLRNYAAGCESITEVGFRGGISASAFMVALPKKFTAIDWDRKPYEVDRVILNNMKQNASDAGIEFNFIKGDSLSQNLEPCDLLFLDGFHTYEHVFLELIKHNASACKFILLHDTDEPSCPGMFHAVEDFLLDNHHWDLEARHRDRPGLTVLRRKDPDFYFHPHYDPPKYPKVLIRILEHAVARQKQMYYSRVSGTESSTWDQYICEERLRYSDRERWPKANDVRGATEMMEAYLNQARQRES